jgi:hypothetical protein
LYQNDQTTGNHWLHIDLVGDPSNKSAIGARVRVVADGASHVREVNAGSGYCSQDSPTLEFGLGSVSTLDTIEVNWPSGNRQVYADPSPTMSVDRRVMYREWDGTTGVDEERLPADLRLENCFPNPFNPSTTISFVLPAQGPVDLSIFDVYGRLVRTLLKNDMSAGEHTTGWDGRDSDGAAASTGIYFVRLEVQGEVRTKKIILMK